MKYWVYLNDEVSQKSYTETELQQLESFGPDVLICSEVSAVSNEPEWKPIRDLLPHLIRPKAPNFNKFRPKPPVPVSNTDEDEESVSSQKNKHFDAGKTHTSHPNDDTSEFNSNLLTQLQSLTAKIASLENKIEEQDMPFSNADPDSLQQDVAAETLVCDPQKEQEDDVLEVPFDNDFEVPFDANKSSEEIAQEAEALLAKPAREIEEYNTDDQNAEFMNYASDMQKILEDTIRETNIPEIEQKKIKPEKRTFIAEDLISKTTLKFTAKEDSDVKGKEASSQEVKGEKQEKGTDSSNEGSENNETEGKNNKAEKTEKEDTLSVDKEKREDVVSEHRDEEDHSKVLEKQNKEQEKVTDRDWKNKSQVKSLEELLDSDSSNMKEQDQTQEENLNSEQINATDDESSMQEENVQKQPHLPSLDEAFLAKEQETARASFKMASLDEIPVRKIETPVEENQEEKIEAKQEAQQKTAEEPKAKPEQEVSPEVKEEPVKEKQEQVQEEIKEKVSVQEIKTPVEENQEEKIEAKQEAQQKTAEEPKAEPEQEVSLEVKEEPVKEKQEQEIEKSIDISLDEFSGGKNSDLHKENTADSNKDQDEYIKTVALDEVPSEEEAAFTEQLKITDDLAEEQQKKESDDKEIRNLVENNKEVYSTISEEETPVVSSDTSSNDNPDEQTSNLSITRSVTISDDDTTAAVLNEIAQEKGLTTQSITDSERLFEELEHSHSDENNDISQILKESEQSVEENIYSSEEVSNEELAKEDEFLKTFTTSVEEVFLDQPTAMISDYVPPNTDGAEHAAPAAAGNNVKREKPSDIKTVPLVPDTLGQEIHSSPYVESGTSKFRKSGLVNAIKWMLVILLIVALTVMALSGLAVMNVIDEKFSPIHTVIYSLQKTPQENETQSEEDLEPEIITQKTPENEMQVSNNEQDQVYTVLEKVKNYTFSDATTLESRINNIHKNSSSNIEWSLIPIEEQNVYSIAVKIPQNTDGQGFSYRFNYDVPGNVLTPTTSEAKNIMENYSK